MVRVIRELIPAWKRTEHKIDVPKGEVHRSGEVVEILKMLIGDDPYENFWVVFLDGKNHLIGVEKIDRGSVCMSTPAIVVGHNHPSGETKPSDEDRIFTRELAKAGEILQFKVLDHIIIGTSANEEENTVYYSFADKGELVS